jgi:hypothetical protein
MIVEIKQFGKVAAERGIGAAVHGAVENVKARQLPVTEQSRARLQTCESCPSKAFDRVNRICNLCDCFVDEKVKVPDEKCPRKHWKK